MTIQKHKIIWNNGIEDIEIVARYEPTAFSGHIAHLEIQSINPERAPLPMTETGYRSHYHSVGTIERDFGGDVVACVEDWLEEAAQDKAWQKSIMASRQLTLF